MSNVTECDLEKTQALYDLFQVPQEERDPEWIREFFMTAPGASFQTFEPQMRRGPDGFPYFILSLPPSDEEFDAYSFNDVVSYCLKNGLGLALFSDPKELTKPEWVFSFGSLWSYDRYGNFVGDPSDEMPESAEENKEAAQAGEARQVQVGAPSDEFLPAYARSAIGRFLKEAVGLETPRVALVTDETLKPTRALMFADLHPDRFEKREHFDQLMYALRWFLPATRGLIGHVKELSTHAVPL